MAKVELIMPKMGESIMEATILKWVKAVGDKVQMDETILEIATDKVDSEIPSPVAGVVSEILYPVDSVVEIGKVIAIISTEGEEVKPSPSVVTESKVEMPKSEPKVDDVPFVPQPVAASTETSAPASATTNEKMSGSSDRFYSPLVKNIAKAEGLSYEELDVIQGSGANGRVTKSDVLTHIELRQNSGGTISGSSQITNTPTKPSAEPLVEKSSQMTSGNKASTSVSGGQEIIEMDRMRRLISDHMVMSKHTSPHVTSFVEADVTDLVRWRDKAKVGFEKKHNEKITFTPIFIEAVARAINDYPMVNVSVDGHNIIVKRDINIGMAAALPSGNLIVPVIKNADQLNLVGLTKQVNDLANRARNNQLKPEEIQGGTFTLTNVGSFGNLMGTPIINQPQVAILAVGSIKKKPAVLETEHGDVIAIRHMMFLSLSYDHRVVDGSLGGSFLRRVADYLEQFDINRAF